MPTPMYVLIFVGGCLVLTLGAFLAARHASKSKNTATLGGLFIFLLGPISACIILWLGLMYDVTSNNGKQVVVIEKNVYQTSPILGGLIRNHYNIVLLVDGDIQERECSKSVYDSVRTYGTYTLRFTDCLGYDMILEPKLK